YGAPVVNFGFSHGYHLQKCLFEDDYPRLTWIFIGGGILRLPMNKIHNSSNAIFNLNHRLLE
ncbi:MAG: hypothetical protein K6U80_09325, partial [Firmicutes bacterium]|nr:hypothetical protein [Bacillota bacterium]